MFGVCMKPLRIVLLSLVALYSFSLLGNCATCGNKTTSTTSSSSNCASNCTGSVKCSELTNSKSLVYGKTFYSPRPQDSNTARKMVGVANKVHLCCPEELNGIADLSLSFQQTFNPSDLATWFSFNGNSSMTYGNAGDGTFNINALNFGVTASGTISFCPRIQNFTANLDLYFGLDEYFSGLWTRLQVPLVYSRWDLRICDKVNGPSGELYDDNSINTFPDKVAFKNLETAWKSQKSVRNTTSIVSCGFGGIPALKSGMLGGRLTHSGVAGLHFDIGRDHRCEKGFFGANLHIVAPVGNTPSSYYLFDAVVGANKSWQIGFGLSGAYQL